MLGRNADRATPIWRCITPYCRRDRARSRLLATARPTASFSVSLRANSAFCARIGAAPAKIKIAEVAAQTTAVQTRSTFPPQFCLCIFSRLLSSGLASTFFDAVMKPTLLICWRTNRILPRLFVPQRFGRLQLRRALRGQIPEKYAHRTRYEERQHDRFPWYGNADVSRKPRPGDQW